MMWVVFFKAKNIQMHDKLLPEDVSAMFSNLHYHHIVRLMRWYLPPPATMGKQFKTSTHISNPGGRS